MTEWLLVRLCSKMIDRIKAFTTGFIDLISYSICSTAHAAKYPMFIYSDVSGSILIHTTAVLHSVYCLSLRIVHGKFISCNLLFVTNWWQCEKDIIVSEVTDYNAKLKKCCRLSS